MSFNHPSTALLEDPLLPEVTTLLSSPTPGPIEAAVASSGGRVEDGELIQVTCWPGISIIARYRISVNGGELGGGRPSSV